MFWVIYYVQINMSQISTFWTEIQGCHLTRLVWRTRIIFRFFSYVAIVHLLRRGEYVGIWFRIPLIKSSHKLTRILFIISNSKLGIWLCSQPRIDLNSQSNFYDVLTRPYKYLSNTLSTLSTKQHALKTIYMLVSPYNWSALGYVHANLYQWSIKKIV